MPSRKYSLGLENQESIPSFLIIFKIFLLSVLFIKGFPVFFEIKIVIGTPHDLV